ncbi:MAG: hypothetical protein E7353_03930 [Clostridiales bacterium]|nr:hypothetical protein [Clostridiales bacterium]
MGRIKGKPTAWVDLGFKESTFNLMKRDSEIKDLTRTDEVEFKKLSRRYFENKNVYDNRVLAQRIGVESATTLPKQELIEKLLDKVWGVQYFSSGYTTLREIEIGKMDADTELTLLEDVKKGDVIIGEECSGVFEARDEGGVLWDIDEHTNCIVETAYVVRNLVGELALKDGDFIKGRMRYVDSVGYCCVFHIDEIDGVLIGDNKRPTSIVRHVSPSEPLEIEGNDRIIMGLQLFAPVCYGQFGVVSTNGRMDFCDQAVKIYKALNKKVLTPYLFVLEEKEYVLNKLEQDLGEEKNVYWSGMGKKCTDVMHKILQYASAQARSNGSKHVIVINDLDMLDKEEKNGLLTAFDVASYAGAYSNGGSVTVIALAGTFSPISAYHSVRNRIDFELALKSNLSVSKNVIDMLSSYSFSDREVTKEETVALAKLQQLAVTEGGSAVERRLLGFASAKEIISQLND